MIYHIAEFSGETATITENKDCFEVRFSFNTSFGRGVVPAQSLDSAKRLVRAEARFLARKRKLPTKFKLSWQVIERCSAIPSPHTQPDTLPRTPAHDLCQRIGHTSKP